MNTLPTHLNNVEEIRVNQRFGTYSARDEVTGELVFVKQVRTPELQDSLRKEAYGLERMAQLAVLHTFNFAIPAIRNMGEDYLITTWVDGETMPFDADLNDLNERVTFLAEGYAAMDIATETVHPGIATLGVPGDKTTSVASRLDILLQAVDVEVYFDTGLIRQSLAYVEEHMPNLTARFTHADFTPSNIIEREGVRTLIDWESADETWPRFYDVVNFTHNRLIVQPELKQALRGLVEQFFAKINSTPQQHLTQLNTLAAVRALDSISNLMTEPNAYHNTTDIMTPEIATQIKIVLGNVLADRPYYA